METSFEELRKIHLHEKRVGSLAQVSEDFFQAYRALLQQQKEELCKSFSLDGARSYENLSKMLKEVVELRQNKILLKALRDLRAGSVSSEGLASEEKELYTSAIKLLKDYEDLLVAPVPKPVELEAACVAGALPSVVKVRILSDIPEAFVGDDGKDYGPFSAGQVVELSGDQASLLVRRKVAEYAERVESAARKKVSVITEGRVEGV
ncbi:MAG: hypothetical protein ACP5O3_00625 [Candidatus Micrarchaeia archaeon]